MQRASKTIPTETVMVVNLLAIGSEGMLLVHAIQESVYGRFGIRLEPEPVVV